MFVALVFALRPGITTPGAAIFGWLSWAKKPLPQLSYLRVVPVDEQLPSRSDQHSPSCDHRRRPAILTP